MSNMLIETVSALIFLVPLCILTGMKFRHFLFAFYLAAVYSLVGLPTVQFLVFDVTLNLIPLLPMADDLRNSILNVALFIPLGFFLPLLWENYRTLSKTLLLGFCATLTIELAQLLTWRVTDINDIITNFVGCALGYGLFHIVYWISGRKIHASHKSKDLWILLCAVTGIMFFLQPITAALLYKLTR